MWRTIFTFCIFSLSIVAQVKYSGHKVFRLNVQTVNQAEALSAVRESYDFWTEIGVGRFAYLLKIEMNDSKH